MVKTVRFCLTSISKNSIFSKLLQTSDFSEKLPLKTEINIIIKNLAYPRNNIKCFPNLLNLFSVHVPKGKKIKIDIQGVYKIL